MSCILGHGLDAGNPTQPAAHPPERSLWYCDLIEPNDWVQPDPGRLLVTLEQADSGQA
jgi:hypothetical protein